MSHVREEIVQFSGVQGRIAGAPVGFDWGTLLQALLAALAGACPAKFANQAVFEATYDKELGRLMKGKDHCPLLLRGVMKKHGVKKKADQDQAYFRLFMSGNGYPLSEIMEGVSGIDPVQEV